MTEATMEITVPAVDSPESAAHGATKIVRVYAKHEDGSYWYSDSPEDDFTDFKFSSFHDMYKTYDNGNTACVVTPTLKIDEKLAMLLMLKSKKIGS